MDDIYFTDKKSRRNGNETNRTSERFTKSEYHDIHSDPSLKKRSAAQNMPQQKKNFTVNIPEDELQTDYRVAQPKRTPVSNRRYDIPSPAPSRTPTGSRVRDEAGYTPAKKSAPPPSRTPQKAPVAPRKKKNKAGGKIVVAVLMMLLVCIIGLFGYGYSLLGEINYDDTITENAYVDKSELFSSKSVTNILIIGSDKRDYDGTEGQRSDSMILFSIDKLHRQIKLTSFLRDSFVYIPDADYEDKLNASFSYGGPQLTMDTIEYNFGVDIDHYVIINFEIFTQLIDLMGGITVDGVTEDELYYMVNTLHFDGVNVGTNKLNGYKALWYCRMRYLDNDFYRTQRQRKVIKSVIKQAASTNLFTLMDIVKQVVPNIETDIPRNELLGLGVGAALSFLRYDIVQQQIPASGTWWDENIDGSDVIALDLDENREILKNFILEKYEEPQTTQVNEDSDDEYYDEEYYDGYYDDEEYY